MSEKAAEAAPQDNKLKYERGNGEYLRIELLILICHKLDEMRNHTRVLVEQNDEIIKQQTRIANALCGEESNE